MQAISRRACLKQAGFGLAGLALPQMLGTQRALAAVPVERQLQTPDHVLQMDVSLATWLARFQQLAIQGYRPIWIQGSPNSGSPASYSSIWVRDGRPNWAEWQDMDAAAYQTRFNQYQSQGYRPISVSGYEDASGANRLAAIWLHDPGVAYAAVHNASPAQYQTFVNDMTAANMVPQAVDGYAIGANAAYMSTWANTGFVPWVARHGLTSAQYQSEFNDWVGQGYRVSSVSAYRVGGTTYFAALWVKDGVAFAASHDVQRDTLFNTAISRANSDYQPVAIEGYDTGATRNFAGVWVRRTRQWTTTGAVNPALSSFDDAMQAFMQARNISSGSLAVTNGSRLVYARGYRWQADTPNVVNPDTLFRIASLSKPLTSMGVMRLVQEGRLNLNDRLMTLLGAGLPTPADPRLQDIRVVHLLQHLGGWNSSAFDPMFEDLTIAGYHGVSLPITKQHIMQFVTAVNNLSFAPGTDVSYSNYGYLLLGRIIEAVTGMTYADYMQSKVFGPLGITRIVLGASEFENRLANEAIYDTIDVELHNNVRRSNAPFNATSPYGRFNLENMDAHGGWLASAVDLACFATAYDATGLRPILNQASIDRTFQEPALDPTPQYGWFGCGWWVDWSKNVQNTWHYGSLWGTWTYLVRRHDGRNLVALFNRRDDPSDPGSTSYGQIGPALDTAADAVTAWPQGDLFGQYGLPSRNPAFTDDPLVAGVTTVRAVHLTELRARVNWLRNRYALAPFVPADGSLGGAVIRAAHVTELRTALGAVYAAASRPAPVYSDPVLTGLPVKAVHIAELRAVVRGIE